MQNIILYFHEMFLLPPPQILFFLWFSTSEEMASLPNTIALPETWGVILFLPLTSNS